MVMTALVHGRHSGCKSLLLQNTPEPLSVVSLDHDQGQIFSQGIGDHDPTHPELVPEEEKRCKENDDPMGQLRPACLREKFFRYPSSLF
jgi:hypothetical protein